MREAGAWIKQKLSGSRCLEAPSEHVTRAHLEARRNIRDDAPDVIIRCHGVAFQDSAQVESVVRIVIGPRTHEEDGFVNCGV